MTLYLKSITANKSQDVSSAEPVVNINNNTVGMCVYVHHCYQWCTWQIWQISALWNAFVAVSIIISSTRYG